MLAVFFGAVVDFTINYLLIPKMGAFGAAIGWVVAEIVITVTQTVYSTRKLPIFLFIKKEIGFVINAVIMYFAVRFVIVKMGDTLVSLVAGVLTGILVYGVLTAIYLFFFRKDLWEILTQYLKNKLRIADKS